MKKPIIILLLLPVVLALTSFARIPGYSVTVDNETSGTETVTLDYYSSSHTLLASHQKTIPANTAVGDAGPSPYTSTYSVTISVSTAVSTLDFWNNTLTYEGGCISSYPGASVTSATFDFTTTYSGYIIYVSNGACR
ncbi:hypothetical protein [Dinghuibacter silviterrae]|uniref:Uncharacterized protein n=1 Tax=Dinghuibacter silviterrae TaxID=1539049 RepID=A0A4R8DX52_9BACT|nr:hypothetical protein [Dinghuibacter silviterrae]TDX02017.1 hypothetical protein EDB95_3064 [Dinghuibacter silviterrae]